MKVRIVNLLVAVLCLIPAHSIAANIWSREYVRIISADFHSIYDDRAPDWQGVMAIKLDPPAVWNSTETNCNPLVLTIYNEDKHLISAALSAIAADKQIKVYVDSAKQVVDGYCFVRALHILK